MTVKIPTCYICHRDFGTWQELALHITQNKKTHGKSRRFAAHVLNDVKDRPQIKRIPSDPDHENTEFGDINRENAVRHLSGENEYTNTICPTCKRESRSLAESEYVNSPTAWRENGKLYINCQSCRETVRR